MSIGTGMGGSVLGHAGLVQPFSSHVHWHIDIAVITIAKTYYYQCSVLDGYSRFVVHCDFLDRMTEADIELIFQRALEAHPGARPGIISDNGPQFIAGDFRRSIDLTGLTHVRTSVNYPVQMRRARGADLHGVVARRVRPGSTHHTWGLD